jgi:AraC-like DNA-binding protein
VVDRKKATASTAGVLHPDEFAQHVQLERRPAGPAVQPWVENHWFLRWDLPEGRWFTSQVLPHPTCSLTVEIATHPRAGLPAGETVVVTGVVTRRFDVDVRGDGLVDGVRFRPGGLSALTGHPASAWKNRTVAARDVLPAHCCDVLAEPGLARDADAWLATAERELCALAPPPDARYEQLLDVVADMLDDRSLLTVADVAARHGVALRTLQRLFTHYVGVGPKWVLARYRMHDAVTELDGGYDGTLTDLAFRYGWYDQTHFTKDFTALVGVTPSQYRDRQR